MEIAQSIVTYIISSGMSVLGASVSRMNLEIMSLPTSNTPGVIRTYIELLTMRTARRPMLSSRSAMFTEESMCFNILAVSLGTSLSLNSSIQCRSACLTTSRSGFSTSWRCTNGSTSTMKSDYPCLLTMTSHHKISHMRKFLNGKGRRWRKWAGTWLEL